MTNPTREQVTAMIDELVAETKTRAEVAAWANRLFTDDALVHTDEIADALEKLGAVDLVGIDRPYLYGIADFVKWRDMLSQ